MADHEHEYVGFSELGRNVRRCKHCLTVEKGQDETEGFIPQPEPIAQGGSGYVDLDTNEPTEAPEGDDEEDNS